MLHVVEAACQFAGDMSQGKVVVESDLTSNFQEAIAELTHADARNMAMGFAARRGMADPRINGNPSGAYAVNAEGVPLDEVRAEDGKTALPQTHARMQPARYRVDIPVVRRLV